MRIQRNRSALRFRRRSSARRWVGSALVVAVLVGYLASNAGVQARFKALWAGEADPLPDPLVVAQQGQTAYFNGDIAQSIDHYGTAAALAPSDMGIQFEYVRMLVYGSYEGSKFGFRATAALQTANRLVLEFPTSPQAHAAYALALVANGRADEGAVAALNAVELNPQWAEAHAYLSLAYAQQNRWQLALDTANHALSLDPLSIDAQRALGLALAYLGDYSQAIYHYEQAIRVHPQLDLLYFELALFYVYQENYDAAIQAYDRVLANNPRNVKAWVSKCRTYYRQRDDANAQEACEQAISLDNTFAEAYNQLGQIQYARRNFEGTIDSAAQCVRLMDSQNWTLTERMEQCYYIQGLAYYYLGNCAAAMPLFREALLLNLTERGREITYQGMQLCAASDPSISVDDLPTAPPPTPTPPAIIEVY